MTEENKTTAIICSTITILLLALIGSLTWSDGQPYRFALRVQENTLACYDKVDKSEVKTLCGTMPTPIIPKDTD